LRATRKYTRNRSLCSGSSRARFHFSTDSSVKPGTTLTSIAEAFINDCFIVFPNAPTSTAANQIPRRGSAAGVTTRKNYTRALTTIPTRTKGNNQNLHRHVHEHPQFRNRGLKLAPKIIGFTFRTSPIVESIPEEFSRLGSLLVFRIRSSVDLFEDEMPSGFDQSAYPSQRIPEVRYLYQIEE